MASVTTESSVAHQGSWVDVQRADRSPGHCRNGRTWTIGVLVVLVLNIQ